MPVPWRAVLRLGRLGRVYGLSRRITNCPFNSEVNMTSSPVHKKTRPDIEKESGILNTATELGHFDKLFPELVDCITKEGLKNGEISDGIKWFRKVLEYNVPHGKKNRGMAVVLSVKFLKGHQVTDADLTIAGVLGWCIEMLQAFFLVADDIMDQSVTRRGQPCWYKNNGVGLIAINDGIFLESAIYVVLKKYIRDKPYYLNIMELFHETTIQTVIGQSLDMLTAPDDKLNFEAFTSERYSAIVKWKTAFYSFYLPVACAMYMAGIDDPDLHKDAKTILLKMGHFFQVQDDFLDCYGDPAVTGKVGTDIEDNKCSWLVIQALQRATPEQRKGLEENYAQKDPKKVEYIKQLYDEMNLRQVYADYEEETYQELVQLIDKLSGALPAEMFTSFAQKIYKRKS